MAGDAICLLGTAPNWFVSFVPKHGGHPCALDSAMPDADVLLLFQRTLHAAPDLMRFSIYLTNTIFNGGIYEPRKNNA
jgi:hypothetical protein